MMKRQTWQNNCLLHFVDCDRAIIYVVGQVVHKGLNIIIRVIFVAKMGFLNIFGFVVVYLICSSSFTDADTCVTRSPCSCVFSNGTGIDLTPADPSTFYTADIYAIKMNGTQYEMSTYYYHPCYDVSINVSQPSPRNTCTSPLSVSSN